MRYRSTDGFVRGLGLGLFVFCAGCHGAATGGEGMDGGRPLGDAGMSPGDAGAPTGDGGVAMGDGGVAMGDGGVAMGDGGAASPDAGTSGLGIPTGSTTTIDCTDAAVVDAALASASSGDTVRCMGDGWSGSVTIPGDKFITLDGNGATVRGDLFIPSSPVYEARVTRFTFASPSRYSITTGNGYTNKPWRMDHCTFAESMVAIMGVGSGPGLIDHLTAENMGSYQQMIEPDYEGPDSDAGWTNDHAPGSANALYIEDSSFRHAGSIWDGASVFQMQYGARVVARKSTLDAVMYEVHGSNQIGGRWWEFYDNTFTATSAICIRAGSGIVFNNVGPTQFFAMLEEDPGYPAAWQVGRGRDQTLTPAYAWANTATPSLNVGGLCSRATADMVQLGRDVFYPTSGTSLPGSCADGQGFWKTDAGGDWDTSNAAANDGALYKCNAAGAWESYYTPYVYPHPLQAWTD